MIRNKKMFSLIIISVFAVLLLILHNLTLAKNKDLKITHQVKNKDYIVFAGGCFWGFEKLFKNTLGVLDTEVGYADGQSANPTYKELINAKDKYSVKNHAEVVKVIFDTKQTSVAELIRIFFENHDVTQINGQGNDLGSQYRSLILITNSEQEQIAQDLKSQYQQLLTAQGYGKITTQIKPLQKFYPAEEYHQDYLKKNPFGYCPNHATGVKFPRTKNSQVDFTIQTPSQNVQDINKLDKQIISALRKGKQIIVVTTEHCGFCREFKQNVGDKYFGDINLTYIDISEINKLDLGIKVEATPTILFIDNAEVVFNHLGSMSVQKFYLALGKFKLGANSEAFNVALGNGTDNRFCKQYDLFKNTPAGFFVDKLSGAKLFSTDDRFDSGSGWLSFSDAVKDSVYLIEDKSYGMHRIEVRSKSSGIHLGHLFYDVPKGANGGARYCINASVVDFVAK